MDRAQGLLEKCTRLKKDFAGPHLELGSLHFSRKEQSQAVMEFLEAVRLEPDSEMAHYRLGQAYRDLGQLDDARRELTRYAELTRTRRERLAQSRSAIRQFVLAQGRSQSKPLGQAVPR